MTRVQLYLFVLMINVVWSMSFVCQKIATISMSLPAVIAWRFTIGALVTGILVKLLGLSFKIPRKIVINLFAVGFLAYCIGPLCQIYGIHHSRAVNAGILIATEPIFNLLVASIFLKEQIKMAGWFGSAVVFCGVLVLGGLFSMDSSNVGSMSINSIILAGVLLESITSPVGKTTTKHISPFVFSFYVFLIAGLSSFMIGFGTGAPMALSGSLSVWCAMIYLSVCCTALAYCGWYWALQYLEVSKCCLFLYCHPVFASLFAWFMLGETLAFEDMAAIALIFGGLWLCIKDDFKKPKEKQPQAVIAIAGY